MSLKFAKVKEEKGTKNMVYLADSRGLEIFPSIFYGITLKIVCVHW